jgi:hypothetical protein
LDALRDLLIANLQLFFFDNFAQQERSPDPVFRTGSKLVSNLGLSFALGLKVIIQRQFLGFEAVHYVVQKVIYFLIRQ